MHLGSDIEMPINSGRPSGEPGVGSLLAGPPLVDFLRPAHPSLRYAEPPVENHMRKRTNGMIDCPLRQGSADGSPSEVMAREVGFSSQWKHQVLATELQIAREHGRTDIDLIAMRAFSEPSKDEAETQWGTALGMVLKRSANDRKPSY